MESTKSLRRITLFFCLSFSRVYLSSFLGSYKSNFVCKLKRNARVEPNEIVDLMLLTSVELKNVLNLRANAD